MTAARIYVYKVTFEGMPWWYWGAHKEKKYGEVYQGSPSTNQWYWRTYHPKIQILEIFEYTDEGWRQARSLEQRLIRPDLNNPLCLNEHCGGTMSIKSLKLGGQRAGILNAENDVSCCGITYNKSAKKKAVSRRTACNMRDLKIGVCGRSPEQMSKDGRKGGLSGTRASKQTAGRLGAEALTIEDRRKGAAHQKTEDKSRGGKISTSQIWESTVDGYQGSACVVARHNKSRGWSPDDRVKIR